MQKRNPAVGNLESRAELSDLRVGVGMDDNPDPSALVSLLYGGLFELEGLAVTADECVTALPVLPTDKYKRTMSRLYVPVGATACHASKVMERSEDILAQLAVTRGGRRPADRRSR